MTIRAAKYGDIPRLTELMIEMYGRSIYRESCGLDIKETKALLMRCIQRNGGKVAGCTLVNVAERAGVVEGFMIAALSKAYGCGTKLIAADTHFYVSSRALARDAFKLIDAFDAWWTSNPEVIEGDLCATDAVGEFRRTEKLYRRKGYGPFGVILVKRVNREQRSVDDLQRPDA